MIAAGLVSLATAIVMYQIAAIRNASATSDQLAERSATRST
jgi:hypothetical protein